MDRKNHDLLPARIALGRPVTGDASRLCSRLKAGKCRPGRCTSILHYGGTGSDVRLCQPPTKNPRGPGFLSLAAPADSRYTLFSKPAGPLPQGMLTSAGFSLRGGWQ